MFQNNRKTIGVFAEGVRYEFQRKLCQGIIEEAEKEGFNVAISSNYGKYGENNAHFFGDQMIWDLPEYEEFAGVILALDTIEDRNSRQMILEHIRKSCDCPVISIREKVEGAVNFLVDNTIGMAGMIRHFIEVHGKKKLCFMSGPESFWDARERMQCFIRTMEEYHLPVTEHQMFYGDYWYNKGAEACNWFLAGETVPEVIVCANDHMALSVASELIHRGIRVPEDVCVSGYDGLKETLAFTPAITTMRVPFKKMGKRAVEIIVENQEKTDWKDLGDVFFDAEILARESCGCLAKASEQIILEKQRDYEKKRAEGDRNLQFDYMSIYLSEADSIEDIAHYVERFHQNLYGIRDYGLCLCRRLHDAEGYKEYTDQMELCVQIKDNQLKKEVRIPFERRELLPGEMLDENPQVWYFAPIHFQDHCYGYEVFRFWNWHETANLHFHWNINIGNKIHDLLIEDKMKTLIDELAYMYDRDELTDWYNRRGLEKQGGDLFVQAKKEQKYVFLCVVDLDGMKQINDNFGHIEGDFALKKVCETIIESCRGEYICARTGGDEFVVIAKNVTEMEGRAWMVKMEKELERFNQSGKKPYDIHASYGITSRIPNKEDSMEQFIKESDEKMYRYKMVNKKSRGEEIR